MKIALDKRLVTTKILFTVTLIIVVIIFLAVWLLGLGQHRQLFENAIISISILSVVFFLFLTIGLFKGIKLKDDLGNITDELKPDKFPNFSNAAAAGDFVTVGEGIGGIIIGALLWLIVMVLFALLLWLFGAVFWSVIVIFVAMLYWIFFRAIRLVFKNANTCKGKFTRSIMYGMAYTLFYSFWIYGIILLSHYFQ